MENDQNLNLGSMGASAIRAMNEAPIEKCPKCGGMFWDDTCLLKTIPGIYTGKKHDQFLPIPVWVCHSCGEVLPKMASMDEFKRLIEPNKEEEKKSTIITE